MNLFQKNFLPDVAMRVRAEVIGLAQDFWKDGSGTSTASPKKTTERAKSVLSAAGDETYNHEELEAKEEKQARWKADRVRVKEKIWGNGNVMPINNELVDKLIKPFGLTKDISVLDLAAGLGGLARKIATDFGSYVTGMEADADIAARGMDQSVNLGLAKRAEIIAYDPKTFVPDRHYDCIIMRELFFRVKDKAHFFKTALSCMKNKGQVSMTDYCLETKDRSNEAVAAWLNHDEGASPVSMEDLTKVMGKMGFDVRTNEDLTEMYLHEILKRLALFAVFLKEHPPEESTKPLVLKEIEKWGLRASALQHGLKFYRFYALKH